MLSHGAKVNCFDKQKLAAPLFCAVASGIDTESESVVDLLLDAGADINLGNHEAQWNLLSRGICQHNEIKYMTKFQIYYLVPRAGCKQFMIRLNSQLSLLLVNIPLYLGTIHVLILFINRFINRVLIGTLKLTISVFLTGLHQLGVSALHVAVRANAVNHVKKLLSHGAIPNHVQLFSETPLHTAAAMGYDECVQLLIEHGASMEVLMGPTKMTALHLGMHCKLYCNRRHQNQ